MQHGVTKDNQSKWLNKYNRNLFGFIVSTKPEYDSAFTYDYFYPEKNIWLTGMPRYDRLVHDERKYVTVMPTCAKAFPQEPMPEGYGSLEKNFRKANISIFMMIFSTTKDFWERQRSTDIPSASCLTQIPLTVCICSVMIHG